jgi:RNA polymerase sigma-70 factor (ECF subfamily)
MSRSATGVWFESAFWMFCAKRAAAPVAESVSETTMQSRDRDVELLRRISGGDRAAFAEFYDLYAALFFSVAVRILNDQKEAEDVLQDVFIQIWEKAASFDAKLGKASSWGMTFARNKAIDRIRAAQRRSRLVEDATAQAVPEATESPSANESLCGRERAEFIRSAVTGLPNEQRQAIELAFFGGLTQNEISERLREPLGTVKARIRRGMLRLRELLEGRL